MNCLVNLFSLSVHDRARMVGHVHSLHFPEIEYITIIITVIITIILLLHHHKRRLAFSSFQW